MRLLGAVIVGAVLVAGCGASDPGSALLDGSISAEPTPSATPTSTLPKVERSVGDGVTDGDQQLGIRYKGWRLVTGSVGEQPIPTKPDLVMRFGETILSFPLSCNAGSVPYEVKGTSIEFDLDYFTTTEMKCGGYDPMDQPNLFEAGLRQVKTVMMSDDGQQLEFKGDGVSMQFVRSIGSSGPHRFMLGRLVCSPGVVVEENVPDTGQNPLEIARAVEPDVVEVEPASPLWWWGLNQDGTVIAALALGDTLGADYQAWTCDP